MGLYVNPEGESKEDFLAKHGQEITIFNALTHDPARDKLAVLLIDNGSFTAAAILFSTREAQRFNRPNVYVTQAYLVPKAALKPWLP